MTLIHYLDPTFTAIQMLRFSVIFLFCNLFSVACLEAQQASSFSDSFDDNRHAWPIIEEPAMRSWMEENSYHMEGKSRALPFFAPRPFSALDRDSFEMSVTITQLSGKRNMGYGLCWGARADRRDCYVFLISSNQKYTILRMERGGYHQLQPWTETDIVLSKKKPNTLTVRREGDSFLYFINDQRVFVGAADPLMGSLAGMILHGKMELKIDDFMLFPASQP